jgi:hypothetical protein
MSNEVSLSSINPLNDLLPVILSAIDKWKDKNKEDDITKKVHNLLDTNRNEITLKLLGFDNRWGSWELDHCNGRSGESAAGDYLRKVQNDAIEDWLKQVKLPVLNKTLSTQMQKKLKEEYDQYLKRYLSDYAQAQASKDAKEIIDDLFSTARAGAVLQLANLIKS